jgi:hypothetical protein
MFKNIRKVALLVHRYLWVLKAELVREGDEAFEGHSDEQTNLSILNVDIYGLFHQFRSGYRDIFSQFRLLLQWGSDLDAARAVAKIGSRLKLNHHKQI